MEDDVSGYPHWTEYAVDMPLILSPEMAKTVNDIAMISQFDMDTILDVLSEMMTGGQRRVRVRT